MGFTERIVQRGGIALASLRSCSRGSAFVAATGQPTRPSGASGGNLDEGFEAGAAIVSDILNTPPDDLNYPMLTKANLEKIYVTHRLVPRQNRGVNNSTRS